MWKKQPLWAGDMGLLQFWGLSDNWVRVGSEGGGPTEVASQARCHGVFRWKAKGPDLRSRKVTLAVERWGTKGTCGEAITEVLGEGWRPV